MTTPSRRTGDLPGRDRRADPVAARPGPHPVALGVQRDSPRKPRP